MPKRNTYHSRGDFFWAKQTEEETPEEFWRRLIEIEKECNFNTISDEELLISKYMTAITDKKLRDKIMKEKTLEMKKIIELIKQNTYEKKNKKNTIPEALISTKEKHIIKEEPIQRMERFGTRPKNRNFSNRPCRFCNAPNWTPLHKCPATDANCNKCGKKGHYAKACRQKFNNNRTVKRLTEDEMNEPTEEETPEEFWRRLIEIEKECNFNTISDEELLISKYMTAITDKKLRDKIMKEKTLEMKKIIELIKQNTYEKKNKKNTIPEALISTKEKHIIKEEPIQRMERFGTRPKNRNFSNRPCRFCNAPNWTPLHKCPATDANCNKCGKKGHYAKACRQKFNNNRTVKRLTEDEMNEPNESSCESEESIHHITEIKKIEETNKHYTANVKINEVIKEFIIDTASPISIMTPDKRIMKTTELQKVSNRYQDVNKNEVKFRGKIPVNIEYEKNKQKMEILITERTDITPLLGMDWMKTFKLTIGRIQLAESNQSEREKIFGKFQGLFENNETIKDTEINIQLKPGHYPIKQKSKTGTTTSTRRCRKRIEETNPNRTSRKNK